MKILFIEDEKSQIEGFERAIGVILKRDNILIEPTFIKKKSDFVLLIKDEQFDAIVVDLMLKQDPKITGNDFLDLLIYKSKSIVTIFTANLNSLEKKFGIIPALEIYIKTKISSEDLLLKIINKYNSLLIPIRELEEKILHDINSVFWNQSYIFQKEYNLLKSSILSKHLKRHLVICLKNIFDATVEIENYLPGEVYIFPPLTSIKKTGDIILKNKIDKYVIVAPLCDMVRKNKFNITLLPIVEIEKLFPKKNTSILKTDYINTTLIKNGKNQCHFLPKYSNFITNTIIDFSSPINITSEELENCSLVAHITEPFAKSIISRYSNYISRLGTPDIKND